MPALFIFMTALLVASVAVFGLGKLAVVGVVVVALLWGTSTRLVGPRRFEPLNAAFSR